jgi:hypothetical protein
MDEILKDKVAESTVQTVEKATSKTIKQLDDFIYHWFKRRHKETIDKNFVEDAEEEAIHEEIRKRCRECVEKIPTDRLINLDKQITTAALDSMLLCDDNTTMRDMFINIMVSTVDSSKRKYAHPSFPHILKQLSPTDASIFSMIKPGKVYKIIPKKTEGSIMIDDNQYVNFGNSANFPDNQNTPLSFTVLSMFGLIAISQEGTTMETYKSDFGSHSATLKNKTPDVKLTPLGVLFYKCCIGE